MEQEIWKVYRNDRVLYEVSDQGRVKRNGIILELDINKPYLRCGIGFIHRMVAELFVDNPNNYKEIDHIDGNKHNNNKDNLRWCTRQMNMLNPITVYRLSKSMSGNKNGSHEGWNKGTKMSHDFCNKVSKSLIGNQRTKGFKYMNDNCIEVYIHSDYWGEFIDIGFKFGRLKSK